MGAIAEERTSKGSEGSAAPDEAEASRSPRPSGGAPTPRTLERAKSANALKIKERAQAAEAVAPATATAVAATRSSSPPPPATPPPPPAAPPTPSEASVYRSQRGWLEAAEKMVTAEASGVNGDGSASRSGDSFLYAPQPTYLPRPPPGPPPGMSTKDFRKVEKIRKSLPMDRRPKEDEGKEVEAPAKRRLSLQNLVKR
jgi:hypothetical protein